MSLETTIAKRYLLGQNDGLSTRFLTTVVILGIAISVSSALFLNALLSGLKKSFFERWGQGSEAIVATLVDSSKQSRDHPPKLPEEFQKLKWSKQISAEVLLESADSESVLEVSKIRGIDPQKNTLEKMAVVFFQDFDSDDFSPPQNFEDEPSHFPGILVSESLLQNFLNPDLIDVIYPLGDIDPSGEIQPKSRRFQVIGTFKKTEEASFGGLIASFDEVRQVLPKTEIPIVWTLEIEDLDQTESMIEAMRSLNPDFELKSWGEKNQKLLSLFKLQKLGVAVLFVLLLLLSGFNLFSLVTGLIVQRQKEIALLKMLGMSSQQINRIFYKIGYSLGVIGTFIGILIFYLALTYFHFHPLWLPGSTSQEELPLESSILLLFIIALLTPIFSMCIGFYSAKKNHDFRIAESLRYE